MDDPNSVPLNIEITSEDATGEEIEGLTRQLRSELQELDIESVESIQRDEKTLLIGSLAITVRTSVLGAVVSFLQSWMLRGHGRTVKFKGRGFEFEGSPEDFQKLLNTLEKRGRLAGDSTTNAPPPKK